MICGTSTVGMIKKNRATLIVEQRERYEGVGEEGVGRLSSGQPLRKINVKRADLQHLYFGNSWVSAHLN